MICVLQHMREDKNRAGLKEQQLSVVEAREVWPRRVITWASLSSS